MQNAKRKGAGSFPVSLFDSENHFRGIAAFPTKAEAQAYLERYQQRMSSRLNDPNIHRIVRHNRKHKMGLRIIESEKLPELKNTANIFAR